MSKRMTRRIAQVKQQFIDQLEWIKAHGSDLSGYIERYGKPGDENCYGDGGPAIHRADVNELIRLANLYAELKWQAAHNIKEV